MNDISKAFGRFSVSESAGGTKSALLGRDSVGFSQLTCSLARMAMVDVRMNEAVTSARFMSSCWIVSCYSLP